MRGVSIAIVSMAVGALISGPGWVYYALSRREREIRTNARRLERSLRERTW